MTETPNPQREARIDRYVRGELTPAEARELAQASLESPELFEELTYSAAAKTALDAAPVGKIVRFPRRMWIAAGAAAAAMVAVWFIGSAITPTRSRTAQEPATSTPALSSSAKPGQPILLAGDLGAAPAGGVDVFRGAEAASRAPRPTGTIVSTADGVAAIDLGTLDGLAKGGELDVFRGDRTVGRVTVTTVFRERARGRIHDGHKIEVGERVRVTNATYMGALLEQVYVLYYRGDSEGAQRMAEQAAGVNGLNAESRVSAAFNTLAVLRMLKGDYQGAEAPLNQAASNALGTEAAHGWSLNNLGVLAELRGDRRKAETLYTQALPGFANSIGPERKAVETNLARVRGAR